MRKRILIIADSTNFWMKNIIMNLLVKNGWDVMIFPIWSENADMNRFYEAQGVTIYHDTHTLPIIRHIPRLRMWARVYCNARKLRNLGPFDAIQNHILSQRDLALGYLVRRQYPNAKWIASFWGSDLLRASNRDLRRMQFFLRRCDHITLNAANSLPVIRQKFGAEIADKTTVTYFGQHIYHTIDTLAAQYDRRACKAHFGIDPESHVIAIGYNASPSQQHLPLLEAIRSLPEEAIRRWTIVLQVTYGSPGPAYLQSLRDATEALPCSTLFLTESMDETECSYLRIAADAFVLASTTDSFSATLREYLYAGAHTFIGSWLQYPEFDAMGIETIPFTAFDQLGTLLAQTAGTPLPPEQMQKRLALKARFSWEAVTQEWNTLYGVQA